APIPRPIRGWVIVVLTRAPAFFGRHPNRFSTCAKWQRPTASRIPLRIIRPNSVVSEHCVPLSILRPPPCRARPRPATDRAQLGQGLFARENAAAALGALHNNWLYRRDRVQWIP